ncbi:hypothetical protein SKAU_G00020840 [Synaphobranchus kaupii]|uniref:DDE Tnp4 domain-containing protein n=1 Tax=Synaphobranchus kaupii TaxID=118154 RepID=A0A9Q1GD15_SYNKA|nr:hypothetical protein SKAU_G00020840 [Synaphobranchus kaupii]
MAARWRARIHRAITLMVLQNPDPVSYTRINNTVPLLQLYFGVQELCEDYRLSWASIEALIQQLPRQKTHGWAHEIEVLLMVYWLAHSLSYRVVARAFGIPRSTVHRAVHLVCSEVLTLLERVIFFPKAEDIPAVGAGFAHLANSPVFSRCVGAIDGCHVRVKVPPGANGQDYINRKLFASIQLQAICDSKGNFLDIHVGYPGSVHDTRVLKNSPVYLGACYPPPGHFIVGDGGYPCICQPMAIITPFREPVQGRVQERYNRHHARPRSIIERAFGMMKTRWRSTFFKTLEVHHIFAPDVIAVCAILHNVCLTAGDVLETEGDDCEQVVVPPSCPVRDQASGQPQRATLAAQLSAPGVLPAALQEHDYI